MQRLWTRDFVLVTLSMFFVFLNLQMMTPTLSSYIHDGLGGNTVIGLSTAAWAVSAVVTRVFAGRLLVAGNKRRVLWAGLIVYFIATAAYFAASSVAALLVVRVVYGVGFGIATAALGTVAADVIPGARIGEGMGYFGLSTSLAMAVAPLIGIGMFDAYGFHMLVGTTTGLVLVAAVAAAFIHSIARHAAQPQRASGIKFSDVYDPSITLQCVLLLLMSFTYGGLVSYITLYGNDIHVANVGWFFLVNAGAVVVVRPFAGRLFDTFGHRAVIPIGAACLMAGLLLLSCAHGMGVFLLSAAFYGVGYGILQPALQAWMFQRLRPERRGIGSGAFYNAMDFGIAVGSVILGAVANVTGIAVMYRLSALCVVLFLALYATFGWRSAPAMEMTAVSGSGRQA